MAAAPATPATPATPASRTTEALQWNNDKPATDGAPAKNPMAAAPATPATPATPASRTTEALQRNNDRPATDGALPDVRQAGSSHYDHGKRAGESKEGASIAAAPQKPISAVGDGQAAPERMTPGGSPDKTLLIRDAVTEAPGSAHDHQQSRNTTLNHQTGLPERDMFPFRMEMPNVVSPQETRPAAAAGSTGIDMQSVIDQIVEARQGAGNDFGRIRILLNPPNLGTVDLDIVVRGERVGVVMTAENATVQQALQSRGDDIRIALQRQDLKIEGFQVLLQDNGTSQQQTYSGEMYRQNRENRERFNANADVPPPAFPVFSPIAGAKSAAGLVSVFA
jgi:flagellar hook-length control protein FliK